MYVCACVSETSFIQSYYGMCVLRRLMKKSLGGDSDGCVGNKPCARPNFTGRREVRALVWRARAHARACVCVRGRV